MRLASLLLLLSLNATAQAQRPDPLKSPACGQAVEALEQARAQASDKGAIEELRKHAAQVCLGQSEQTRAPVRAPYPPVAVAPPAIHPPRAPAPQATVPQPPRPPAIQRPPIITACDAAGCWDSNGNRLNRAGPTLLGPNGVCTQVAGVLSCP
jgi:hypothetical protein